MIKIKTTYGDSLEILHDLEDKLLKEHSLTKDYGKDGKKFCKNYDYYYFDLNYFIQ